MLSPANREIQRSSGIIVGNARNLTYAVERWAWYQQEGPPEPFSHPGSSLHLIPLIAWATSLGHQHSPNSGPAKASSYSCCNREQPSHLKPSIPRTDARSLTGCLPPTSTSCPFGTSRLPLVHVGDCRGRSSQESAILRKEREDRVDVNEACEPVAAHGVPAAARTTHRRTEPGGRRAAHLVH